MRQSHWSRERPWRSATKRPRVSEGWEGGGGWVVEGEQASTVYASQPGQASGVNGWMEGASQAHEGSGDGGRKRRRVFNGTNGLSSMRVENPENRSICSIHRLGANLSDLGFGSRISPTARDREIDGECGKVWLVGGCWVCTPRPGPGASIQLVSLIIGPSDIDAPSLSSSELSLGFGPGLRSSTGSCVGIWHLTQPCLLGLYVRSHPRRLRRYERT